MSDDFNDLISLKKELNKVQQSFREQVFLIEKRLKKIEDIQSSENDNSLSSLKKELKKIKESFREQIFLIENKLKNIEKKNEKDKKNIEDIGSLIKASEEIIKDKADKVDKKPLYNVEAVKKATLKQDKNSKEKSKLINQSQVKELAENIVLDSILGVFSHFTTFASKIYKHYKKEDKLAIFFMTLLGVIIFLFGAGFFLIYSFENIETSYRIMIGLLASFAFLYSGHYLSKKEEYKDYASSLLAVSVILNYLLI